MIMRAIAILPLLASLGAVEWPEVPDPVGLGPRLAIISALNDAGVTVPAGTSDDDLAHYWRHHQQHPMTPGSNAATVASARDAVQRDIDRRDQASLRAQLAQAQQQIAELRGRAEQAEAQMAHANRVSLAAERALADAQARAQAAEQRVLELEPRVAIAVGLAEQARDLAQNFQADEQAMRQQASRLAADLVAARRRLADMDAMAAELAATQARLVETTVDLETARGVLRRHGLSQ